MLEVWEFMNNLGNMVNSLSQRAFNFCHGTDPDFQWGNNNKNRGHSYCAHILQKVGDQSASQ